MIKYGRKIKTGIFIGSFFSMTIFCIIMGKFIFGYNVTDEDDLSVYKSFLRIRDPENSTWTDFYIKDEVFGKRTIVLKRNLRIEGMNNNEKVTYYREGLPASLITQDRNSISYKDGINDCRIINDGKNLEITVIRR